MKLSRDTLSKLKNFSEINNNILIKTGSRLTTVNAWPPSLFAETSIEESFEVSEEGFGIYDLPEFLGLVSLFTDPELTLNDKYITISEGDTSIKYFEANKSVLTYSQKDIKFPESDIDFSITSNTLSSIRKTAAMLKTSTATIIGENNKISIQVGDRKNATANTFTSVVGETDKEFTVILDVDRLKFIPGDYDVSISSKKLCRFVNPTTNTTYYVAVETGTTFNF